MSDDDVENRFTPQSDRELQLMLTNSVWGQNEVPLGLKQKLTKYFIQYDESGNPLVDGAGEVVIKEESLWALHGMYTRDIRLSNLDAKNGELQAVQHYLNLAHDLLNSGYINTFVVALSRAATIIETSQGKSGFLRKNQTTLRNESIRQDLEPPKKSFFGGKSGGQL